MGAWGSGIFENDDASEWLADFAVRRSFQRPPINLHEFEPKLWGNDVPDVAIQHLRLHPGANGLSGLGLFGVYNPAPA
jgi:hypothetical protein